VHDVSLISTIAMGLLLAFCFGFLASKLRLPPLLGYLVAGIAAGPFTPGFVADAAIAGQLAEVGVILLMFGVGLHFSFADLMAVRWIAIPGAMLQILVATSIGATIAVAWGWSVPAGIVLGLALSVASTVVLLRALEERNALDTGNGRIAVGWLIVEDLAMVLALVLLPAFAEATGSQGTGGGHGPAAAAGGLDLALDIGITLAKVGLFLAIAVLLGPRVVPWVLGQVARTGSRELFTLCVLSSALGIAYGAAVIFGVSFALGAFFAGLVLNKSDLSHRAAQDSLPLQDAFAVLFFVSVGMLFDPAVLVQDPLAVVAVLLVILVGKALAALAIVLAPGYPTGTALTVSVSLAQVGEFSFILGALGISLGLLPVEGRDLILAGAILSIMLNPALFRAIDPVQAWLAGRLPRLVAFDTARTARLEALEDALAEARGEARAQAKAGSRLPTAKLLDKLPMFADLKPHEREDLLTLLRPRQMEPGERLIRAGDEPDMLYFISSGAVEVSVGERKIPLGPGDFFGEMALLSGEPRSADVTAIDYGFLLTLDQADFRRFVERYPEIRIQLNRVAAARRAANRGNTPETGVAAT